MIDGMATTTNSKKSTTTKTTKTATKSKASKPVAKRSAVSKRASITGKKTTAATPAKKATTKTTATKATKKSTSRKSTASKSVTPPLIETAKKITLSSPLTVTKTYKALNKLQKLNIWNYALAALHAAQGVAIILLSNTNSLFPVSTNFITQDSLASSEGMPVLVEAQRNILDINLAYVVAAFFFMSAIAHLYVATVYRKRYEANLDKGINKVRWYEYAVSASTMMVGIALLTGISDLSTLVMIFGATAVMNLCGLIMEVHNQTTSRTNWLSYVIGTIAGLGPWAVIGIYFWGNQQYGGGGVPTFVYGIYVSIFLFFMSFAVNMYLQYKGKGKWSDYLFGEKGYMVLSLLAKTALAWQIFAGTLRP
jgi:hypothetical protein